MIETAQRHQSQERNRKRKAMPKYRMISEDIRRKICIGQLNAGSKLPIREELMTEYGVTRTTIDRALKELVNEGMISASRRTGTFVKDYPVSDKIAIISWQQSVMLHRKHWRESSVYYTMFGTFIREIPKGKFEFISPDVLHRNMGIIRKYRRVLWCNLLEEDFKKAVKVIGDKSRLLVLNRYYHGSNYISTNHRKAAYDLTEQFCSRIKHGKILYLNPPLYDFSSPFIANERFAGFVDCCEHYNRFYRVLDLKEDFNFNLELMKRQFRELSMENPGIIISPSADTLGNFLAVMRECGLELNKEIFYGDFDNENSHKACGIRITSVVQNFEDIAYTAIENLNRSNVQKFIPYKIVNNPFSTT